ncbi:hypothetical protein TNIN_233391 [Trichonephila inaurata madagascariensis]|uniref:Uncharacterized protein n=1 Tax=Trichonephila inaurata madagascariensis TaxID=2747483 RepID=A0A8X7CI25_9ARAC|nr:hypothetical protein TNIN_233391 [Trichonephila inaurata madagascariensis]
MIRETLVVGALRTDFFPLGVFCLPPRMPQFRRETLSVGFLPLPLGVFGPPSRCHRREEKLLELGFPLIGVLFFPAVASKIRNSASLFSLGTLCQGNFRCIGSSLHHERKTLQDSDLSGIPLQGRVRLWSDCISNTKGCDSTFHLAFEPLEEPLHDSEPTSLPLQGQVTAC